MARKKKQEEHENHERWLVSYADFITLLFAFFVVMYSISSVNEGKYRVLSNSIVTAFNKEVKTLDPIQNGSPLRAPIIQHNLMKQKDDENHPRVGVDYQIVPTAEELAQMQKIADEVKINMQELVDEGLAKVNKTNKGVEIEISSEILFGSGKAVLNRKAMDVLRRISGILGNNNSDINIEGFTDNVPISTWIYPSNWELSAARAASVVRLFSTSGIEARRLVAVGYGEHKPLAPNTTEAGRKQNRRIAIMVLNRPRDDRIEIDDRTREEKEADAKRKLMKSFSGKSNKAGSVKAQPESKTAPVKLPTRSQPIMLGGTAIPARKDQDNNSSSGSPSGSAPAGVSKTTAPTLIGAPQKTAPEEKGAPSRSAVIRLPKPTAIPGQ